MKSDSTVRCCLQQLVTVLVVLVAVALQFAFFNRGSSDDKGPRQRNHFELCTRRLAN